MVLEEVEARALMNVNDKTKTGRQKQDSQTWILQIDELIKYDNPLQPGFRTRAIVSTLWRQNQPESSKITPAFGNVDRATVFLWLKDIKLFHYLEWLFKRKPSNGSHKKQKWNYEFFRLLTEDSEEKNREIYKEEHTAKFNSLIRAFSRIEQRDFFFLQVVIFNRKV